MQTENRIEWMFWLFTKAMRDNSVKNRKQHPLSLALIDNWLYQQLKVH